MRLASISALMVGACATAEPPPAPPPPPPKHAVLIVIDTLRADAMADAQTPIIDGVAAAGAQAERAWAAGTWTVPSVVSLLTGMPVRQHGWNLPTGRIGRYPPLPDVPTLASVLGGVGFGTSGFYANPYLAEELGFSRGFEVWRRTMDKSMPKRLADDVSSRWSDGRRHFSYVHLIGPHSPLKPSPAARERWNVSAEWIDPKMGFGIGVAKRNRREGARDAYARGYRAVIEDTDARVGEVLAALGPHRADTLIVITSDHGELLGDHGVAGHGTWVWEGLTNVPLVVDHPGIPGETEALPTAMTGAALPNLITTSLGVAHDWPTQDPLPMVAQREAWVAMSADGRTKGIWEPGEAGQRFDLETDPGEETPLAIGDLEDARARWEARVPIGEVGELVELPKETMEDLKALGYLK